MTSKILWDNENFLGIFRFFDFMEYKLLFEALLSAKSLVESLYLSSQEMYELKQVILCGQGERKLDLPNDMEIQYNDVAAKIHDITIQISQLTFFKKHFDNIFHVLTQCYEFDDDQQRFF